MRPPNEIEEELRLAGLVWADLDGAASLKEEAKKGVKSKLVLSSKASSIAMRDAEAEASDEYQMFIKDMVNARTMALRAKVKYDCLKVQAELIRTQESTRRAEMRM